VQWQVNVFDYGPSGEVMTARYSVKLTKAAWSAKTLYGVFWESFHQTSDQLLPPAAPSTVGHRLSLWRAIVRSVRANVPWSWPDGGGVGVGWSRGPV
jgi:hypothetical protein